MWDSIINISGIMKRFCVCKLLWAHAMIFNVCFFLEYYWKYCWACLLWLANDDKYGGGHLCCAFRDRYLYSHLSTALLFERSKFLLVWSFIRLLAFVLSMTWWHLSSSKFNQQLEVQFRNTISTIYIYYLHSLSLE